MMVEDVLPGPAAFVVRRCEQSEQCSIIVPSLPGKMWGGGGKWCVLKYGTDACTGPGPSTALASSFFTPRVVPKALLPTCTNTIYAGLRSLVNPHASLESGQPWRKTRLNADQKFCLTWVCKRSMSTKNAALCCAFTMTLLLTDCTTGTHPYTV